MGRRGVTRRGSAEGRVPCIAAAPNVSRHVRDPWLPVESLGQRRRYGKDCWEPFSGETRVSVTEASGEAATEGETAEGRSKDARRSHSHSLTRRRIRPSPATQDGRFLSRSGSSGSFSGGTGRDRTVAEGTPRKESLIVSHSDLVHPRRPATVGTVTRSPSGTAVHGATLGHSFLTRTTQSHGSQSYCRK